MSSPSESETVAKADRPTWVIGHKNPDTDAICSAIAYADLLRQTRIPDAEAACCGPPNQRTEWVLSQAGIGRPKLMPDVYLRAEDICRSEVATAKITDTVIEAYRQMTSLNFRSLPVADENGSLVGMLALQELLALLIPETGQGEDARKVNTSTRNISRILGGDFVNETEHCDEEKDYLMMVAGSSEPVMSERIARFPSDQLIIITGDRVGVQLHAVEAGVRCLVITSGFQPSAAIVAAAKAANTAIIVTDHDTASTTQLIRGARSIQGAVSDNFTKFSPDVRISVIKEKVKSLRKQALFPVCDPESQELIGVFSRTDLVNPERPKLVLVDHNEFSQAVSGADEAHIIEVMDHHRLSGNLITKEPVQFINLTVGSTCTIVGNSFRINNLTPVKSTALCICAGIISDTLNLTSPTTTDLDQEILGWASEIAGIDVDKFKEFFFAAGSVLRGSDIKQAVGSDRKEFEESGYKLSISQVEEIGFDYFWPSREELQEELRNLIAERGLDFACLMVTDITQNDSLLLIEASNEIRSRISYPKKDSHLFNLRGVVSRKKQLFPYISSVLAEIPITDED
ncbi:MAG: putative manganese-dependent inorganic diphosphatase [Verrucomicrobiales bacterium]|nr:putative manganese-dependent inorganic diphosphatase [Verrucomicrobiales bacterium]